MHLPHHQKPSRQIIQKINKLERKIKTLKTKIQENNAEIKEIRAFSKGKNNIVKDNEKRR